MRHNSLQPSHDFAERTMAKIHGIERRIRFVKDGFIVLLAFSPFAVRQAWLFFRGDYFSVGSLPMGGYIVRAYSFFLSAQAMYALAFLSLGLLFLYVVKTRKSPVFTFLRIS